MSYPYPAPGPTPQYAPPYQPSPQQGYVPDSKNPYEGDRFKPKKKLNDPIFLILFILQFGAFVALGGIALKSWVDNDGYGGGLGEEGGQSGLAVTLNSSTAYLLLLVTATSLVLCLIQFWLTRMFPRAIMHVALVLSVCLNIGLCVYFWLTKYYSGAIIFTVLAIFSLIAYFGFRSRIPLAALLLSVVMDISKHHKSVFVVAFISLVLQALLSVFYVFAMQATYGKWTPGSPACTPSNSCSSSTVTGLIFYLTFAYLWTSQVIGNVALATLAGGPYGCWYYFGPRERGLMPPHPTWSSFTRASTLSLGSIAFGSLIVTILETIKLIFRTLQNVAAEDGDAIGAILACVAACCIGCIESLVEWFNRYAYIEIALYGKAYIPAAKDTWRLLVDRGIDALVNDSLVGMTLIWGGYAIGVIGALFAYLYLRFTDPAYNQDGQYTPVILLFSFIVAMQCSITMSSAIEAGVSTIFVCLGEDPHILAIRAPQLFGMIADTYPHVVTGVPRV